MIPYPYNLVDMGGIDLAEANGTVVSGIYERITEAANLCGDVVLYNWKFAGIEIAPQHTTILIGDPLVINGSIQVTEQDEITVPGINPEVKLVPLIATENHARYNAQDYFADGFSIVDVNVPSDLPWPSLDVYNFVTTVRPQYQGGYEYTSYVYGTQFEEECGLVLLADASQGADSIQLSDSISNYSGVVLQGVYNKNRISGYNTTILYLSPQLGISYWAGMKDRNSNYTCNVTFISEVEAALTGNKQVIIYGIP